MDYVYNCKKLKLALIYINIFDIIKLVIYAVIRISIPSYLIIVEGILGS